MAKLFLSKAETTTKITADEAEEWFNYLKVHTESHVRKTYPWHWHKGYWPMKAVVKNGAEKKPKFILNHHTGGTKTSPAFYRFVQSKKASSNAIIERNGNIIQLASPFDATYHAVLRANSPLNSLKMKRLFNIEKGWVNEYGIETVGNGRAEKWLFEPKQFKSVIVLQRYLKALYDSIEGIKSHREFSPKSRAGDPGPLYMLPLIEHAIFEDVDLNDKNYWLKSYEKNPVRFANDATHWFKEYGVEDKDEWKSERRKKITEKNILKIK